MSAPPGLRTNRAYRRLLAAATITNLGDGVAIIAYPWLASAITRDGFLIAVVIVAQRLPWLVLSLPAGVVTDRVDRRRLIVSMDVVRAAITLAVAAAVLVRQGELPDPSEATTSAVSSPVLYVLLLVATLLLGTAEVLRDNAAQTLLPDLVADEDLERANGRLQSAELVSNAFVGPPLGSFLLVVAFSVPFLFDAATFAVAAAVMASIPGSFGAPPSEAPAPRAAWHRELRDGFGWLWRHRLLRALALALGGLNLLSTMTLATLVLFSQEVLGTSATEFSLLLTGAALGGVVGGLVTAAVSARIGAGGVLWATLLGTAVLSAVTGLAGRWPVVWLAIATSSLIGTMWNVVTVSLRQRVIPRHLLGRVNSVYRFFGWGAIPVGALLGGATVAITDAVASRDLALRMPWFVSAVGGILLFALFARTLTTANIDAARAEAAARDAPGRSIDPS